MATHTTNYQNAFIEIAEDSPALAGTPPPAKDENPTIAQLQFEMLKSNPYKYSSDDVIFEVYATRSHISKNERKAAREAFFSKGQACMRASPLTKRYGWGVHFNEKGQIALIGAETKEYSKFVKDEGLTKYKAMKSKR